MNDRLGRVWTRTVRRVRRFSISFVYFDNNYRCVYPNIIENECDNLEVHYLDT